MRFRMEGEKMTNGLFDDDDDNEGLPVIDPTESLVREDAADVASQDSEIDFDDEVDDEVGPIDVVEAKQVGGLLDDPEELDDDE
jgi:hypothetical protein